MTYNGHELHEFVSQRCSAYVSQNDVHIGEMTVRETLGFSATCQGVGYAFGKCDIKHLIFSFFFHHYYFIII